MNERNRKKLILLIGAIVMALAMTVLVFVLTTLDQKVSDQSVALAKQKEAEQKKQEGTSQTGTDREPEGTLILGDYEYHYYDNLETYLVIGTDGSGNDSEDPEQYVGDMADFLVLLVIDRTTQSYSGIQINRDTMMRVPIVNPDGSAHASSIQQICTAHYYGGDVSMGDENTVSCVSELLGGIPIDGYYTMDMDQIGVLNHAVDGVDVMIEDDFSKDEPSLVMGQTVHLTDEQAVSFVRGRMSVGDGQNTSRMKRQRTYMNAFYEKVKSLSAEDPAFINNLYKDLMSLASTNLSGNDVSRITNGVLSFENKGLKTIEGKQETGKAAGDLEDHVQFYPDEASVIEVLTQVCSLEKGEKIEVEDEEDIDDEDEDEDEDLDDDEEVDDEE